MKGSPWQLDPPRAGEIEIKSRIAITHEEIQVENSIDERWDSSPKRHRIGKEDINEY